jgi:hypothetical protein
MSHRFVPIGFDAREAPELAEYLHGQWRISGRGPALSTDENIWLELWTALERLQRPIELPEWHGSRQHLWDSLPNLEVFLTAHDAKLPKPYWVIAIGWSDTIRPPREIHGVDVVIPYSEDAFVDYTDPLETDPAWELLGYDVSDFWLQSAVSNCGLWSEEFDGRNALYEGDLNEHILFCSPDIADQFRQDADLLVPEHAPFFVYSLHKIRVVG